MELHSTFAQNVYNDLKSNRYKHLYRFPAELISDSSAPDIKEKCIRAVYEIAISHITPGKEDSVATMTAAYYRNRLTEYFFPLRDLLKTICHQTGRSEQFQFLTDLVDHSFEALKAKLESELKTHPANYEIHDLKYFMSLAGVPEYTPSLPAASLNSGFCSTREAVLELWVTHNSRCLTFYNRTYPEYQALINRIAELLDMIGWDLPEMTEQETVADYLRRVAACD